jgi:hypothetical protein
MRYTIPAQITGWTKRFSGKMPDGNRPVTPIEAKSSPSLPATSQKPKRKAAVKKAVTKRKPPIPFPRPVAKSKPETKPVTKPRPEAKALVFFKKEPVTFQIRRLEHPADYERMVFAVKACSNDSQRKYLAVLHVEQTRDGSWLVGTDGKRLHAAMIPAKIRSGDYKPVITKEAVSLGEPVTGIMFPAWRKVIPGDTVQRGMIDLTDSGWGKDRNQTEKLSVAFNDFMRQTGELVNLRYLEDLAKKKWSLHCKRERNKAIMLKAEGVKLDMLAVIMPLAAETAARAA